jgi:taurine dioxygenase
MGLLDERCKPVTSFRRIEVKPIAGALGAEIASVDVGLVDDETFKEIEAAWLEHLVVFFRSQTITPEQQIAFAKRFGEIHHHPFIKGMDEYPDILEIIKEEGDTRAFGEVWHTDQMFNPKPAKATMLYAKETPDAGGDTLFANMYLAYDALSDPMKEMLKGIKTWNVGDRRKLSQNDEMGSTREGRYAGNEKMAAKVRDPGDLQTESAHPLVRTHPESGRKAVHRQSHANARRFQARRGAAASRFPDDACRSARVYLPIPLGGWFAGDLGQPLHPAPRAQRLPGQASTHAPDHHFG